MLQPFKLVTYSIVASIFGILIQQQLDYICGTVEAKSYEQRSTNYPQAQTYGQNTGGQYNQAQYQRGPQQYGANNNIGQAGGRYPQNSQQTYAGAGNQGAASLYLSDECNSGDARTTHKYRTTVANETVNNYPYTNVPDPTGLKTIIELCCPGYARVEIGRRSYKCIPECEDCRNGHCIAPNYCECFDGFVRNDNGDCVFSCPLGCLNGRCFLDGSCKCDPGYKLDETRRYCRPICSRGCGTDPMHNCTAPEVCGCVKGYILADRGCEAVCSPDCGMGGVCTKDGKCRCNSNYVNKDGVCQSDCYQKCENGMCYSPNRCICNLGFVYNERTRSCVPK